MPILSNEFVRVTLRRLLQLTDERAQAEAQTAKSFTEQTAAADKEFRQRSQQFQKRWDLERSIVDDEHRKSLGERTAEFDAEKKAIDDEFNKSWREATERFEQEDERLKKESQEGNWTLEAIFDANKKKAKEQLAQTQRLFDEHRLNIQQLRVEVADQLEEWRQIPKGVEGPISQETAAKLGPPAQAASLRMTTARGQHQRLKRLIAPKLLVGDRLLYMGLVAWLVLGCLVLVGLRVFDQPWLSAILGGIAGGALLALFAALLAKWLLSMRARNQVDRICQPQHRALAEAETLCMLGCTEADEVCRKQIAKDKLQFHADLQKTETLHQKQMAANQADREAALQSAEQKRGGKAAEMTTRRDREIGRLVADHQKQLDALTEQFGGEIDRANEKLEKTQRTARHDCDEAFRRLSETWHAGLTQLRADLEFIRSENERLFPDWSSPEWRAWQPARSVPGGMRFGSVSLDIRDRQPTDERLERLPKDSLALPALLPFPQRGSTLLRCDDVPGKTAAVQTLQTMMLRFLTSLPPGKVRFTILDPVGFGENFAAFMHLADHDELLVSSRIWTESSQIEKRLADLTLHMENVIQKYLRSQYQSIEEYNAQAGEVAEPYRVLVVANFPANFTLEAARRLERIAGSGAGCGVYTLVSVDSKLPLPHGYAATDLEHVSLNLNWQDGRFVWKDADFGSYPLSLDAPPPADVLLKTLHTIGEQAKDANRVEVDFDFITPPVERRWTWDSRGGIDVPLGRAGATKRQHLQLGRGTAQHVLVAGKTGSGKSTLLHALITNLALHYSPEEIELYLIDFKKGVEFKTYVTHALPHARVVAVESEREFGLSVLQRLDTELKRRGDQFRMAGVQDLAGYRKWLSDQNRKAAFSRILLIVDEFQEFFVEDDKISQEAALLLDRLVRQGRAFGLHVLLGSQTLGGAYSLARSTIDQMAVRIALQCSEADANLILSKDNGAARLLSRPGEAIYNDANGLVEGNDIFQVVWLPENRREVYLDDVRKLAERDGFRPPSPTIVFEGNIPSDITKNYLLKRKLDAAAPIEPPREVHAWLGDALAIKDPTAAVLRRQSGSNVLMVGQQADAARGVMLSAVVSILAQQPPSEDSAFPFVTVFDGTPADDPHYRYFEQATAGWPGIRVVGPREANDVMAELSEELERRQRESEGLLPVASLIVFGLHRFRDLRKADDDFGFGRRGDQAVSPAQRFISLLREGPAHGMHNMIWCDTLTNVNRSLDRQALREFEMKVLFQMSLADSSTLIDTPAASKLGVQRALFATEEQSAPEKFRPYSWPTDEWLAQVRDRLLARQKALICS